MTGSQLPDDITLSAPDASAGPTTALSCTATCCTISLSSLARMSLMEGPSLAARMTLEPSLSSSLASGSMPSTTSLPALSTKRTALRYPFCAIASLTPSRSSTAQGRGSSWSRVDAKLPAPVAPDACSCADAAAPRSNMLPAKTPLRVCSSLSGVPCIPSSSASRLGRICRAAASSCALTALNTSWKPALRRHFSLMSHSVRHVRGCAVKPGTCAVGSSRMSSAAWKVDSKASAHLIL
mmetsp:Transcript_26489/g.67357  ORF Transcript_26489/g.67357 Transcript_26489/m.67357 type:complete len:238 (-) Transcript_26489:194-907(-)